MKIKEIERTANIAWSFESMHLAAGTAAQQLDASFNTTAVLELYLLDVTEPGLDMPLKKTTQSEHRFHKLIWGSHGSFTGTIVGGCDGGLIQIYDIETTSGDIALISQQSKHKGSVRALDFNTFQNNLLASGASESEIYIWDLYNLNTPMTPGSKCQPSEDVTSVAWNKQVQHILASSFSTKCVVWDLRKNDPIIKLTDSTIRTKWNVVAWNPDIATQLCLASEDDQSPVIQLWDLRFATSPLKIFNNHQKGVLSLSWCHQDTDMLLSCGKDNKIICWNPNNNAPGGDIVCDFLLTNQWNFDVSWCPHNPALFACSSFDGHVSIYSVIGGGQQVQTSNKIADSFPGMELYTQAPLMQTHSVPVDLKKPPKWLKRPVGAKFGFGGKIVAFENVISTNHEIPPSRIIHLCQLNIAPELVSRSSQLESALQNRQCANFCQNKIAQSGSAHDKMIWQFLAANFEPSPRTQFLNLLGFQIEHLNEKLAKVIDKPTSARVNEVEQITSRIAGLGRSTDSESELDGCEEVTYQQNYLLDEDLTSNSMKKAAAADAVVSNPQSPVSGFKISAGDDVDGLICQALLLGNIEAAVDLCLQDNRMADAIILAMTGGSELLAKTQYVYFQQTTGYLSTLISAVVTEDWSNVVRSCDVESWKEALAAALTHANDQEFPVLCEMLGERLENEKNGSFAEYAELCYICAGNLSKIVASWVKREKTVMPNDLQDLVELVMILKYAMELQRGKVEISGRLASLLSNYAKILVMQGSLEAALSYLGDSDDELIVDLRDRINGSLGRNPKFLQSAATAKKHISSQPPTQKSRAISAGFYTPQTVQNDVVTAPPILQHNFNLNPLKNTPTSISSSFTPTPYVPVPPMAPTGIPLPQQATPPTSRAFPSASPAPGGLRAKHILDPSVQSASTHTGFYSQNQYQSSVFPQPAYNLNSSGYPTEAFNPPPTNHTPPPPPSIPASLPQPPGWNDPPVVDSSRNFSYGAHCEISAEHAGTRKWKSMMSKTTQPKTEFPSPNPITQPLLTGPMGDTIMNGQMYNPYYTSQVQSQAPPPPNISHMQQAQFQSFPGQQLPYPQYPSPNLPQPNLSNPKSVSHVKEVIPEPAKKPIPDEHLNLQNIFDELRNRCSVAANNPQSKRKLDEVSKKLEILYDGLRENRLSTNTLQCLHQMAQYVQAGDYTNGLMLHTRLVSSPDFSQISGFMPGIKVLLQSALQLQVYL